MTRFRLCDWFLLPENILEKGIRDQIGGMNFGKLKVVQYDYNLKIHTFPRASPLVSLNDFWNI